jgi:hypothetical protein
MIRRLAIIAASAAIACTVVSGPVSAASSSHASCTGQFGSVAASLFVPLGQTIVVPEVRNLSFGGPNLGQEVKVLFATADRSACPVVAAP